MHLPISHLSGYEEDVASEDHLQAHHLTHSATSNDDEAASHNSQSQGSAKETKDDPYTEATPSTPTDQLQRPLKDLPCPRCQSMNTKFCYYNNYSVNQPRHFCRNCQRYWTVGGTLRNVPVGGGSRKKSSRSSSRAKTDPYYRGVDGASALTSHPNEMSTSIADPGACSFSKSPFLNQFGLPFPFTMSPDEEAELQAFSQQAGLMSTAAAMMGSGLWVPDLEPTHVALMQKAAMWAEAQQRLQTMTRRALWADECKPSQELVQQLAAISPPTPPIQRPPAESAPPHRRPGFWETALMHSRREPKPEGDQPQSLHNINDIPSETNVPYSQRVESPSWPGPGSVNSEIMFY